MSLSQSWNPCLLRLSTVTPRCPSLLPVSKMALNPRSRTSLYSFKLEGNGGTGGDRRPGRPARPRERGKTKLRPRLLAPPAPAAAPRVAAAAGAGLLREDAARYWALRRGRPGRRTSSMVGAAEDGARGARENRQHAVEAVVAAGTAGSRGGRRGRVVRRRGSDGKYGRETLMTPNG